MEKISEPHWIKNAIVYHIYVRSFQDSNGDGVGDLPGLIQRLDYLNDGTSKSLGINTIWLSPIYPSPMKDFGYDIADYQNIDPMFGTLEDFDNLIKEAHQRGIRVLMDYVPNHTSSQHPWFLDSKKSTQSDKRNWYIWRPGKADGTPPNNWLSVFGGSAWELEPETNQYYLHSFDKDQPDLNWRNPDVVKAMKDNLRFWLERGVDGFRVDAYDFLFKHDDFLDEPANPDYVATTHGPHDSLLHVYSFSQPETLEMLKEIAGVIEEYGQKLMVTEVYVSQEKLIEMYLHVDKEWFFPFNFGMIRWPWSAGFYKQAIDFYDQKVGQLYQPNYVLGNHDQHRVASRLGLAQARNAAVLLFTLRGLPFVYYGDELGMEDGVIPPLKIQDPFELKTPGLGLGRDPERTPMQWSDDRNAGFSDGEPWLPLPKDAQHNTVMNQQNDLKSFLNLYKQLIRLKKELPALRRGTYVSLPMTNENVFGFVRAHESQSLLVLVNFTNKKQAFNSDLTKGKVLLDTVNKYSKDDELKLREVALIPNQALILELH